MVTPLQMSQADALQKARKIKRRLLGYEPLFEWLSA